MGVTVLQQYPMIENRTGPQTIEFLTKRVVALGAVQVGQFLVDCETYMSVPQLETIGKRLQSLDASALDSMHNITSSLQCF
ncbi:mediator of RNA polymerase II transcription subunit 20-like isoform X3 [Temnothorax nylanderi]|uniref:mediator of RNA polymerase II transcription subunit 20-like isoform X3 n=1 Tax=Temnothorax nylanderi TaxID=102681 RepID=UPI003A83D05A